MKTDDLIDLAKLGLTAFIIFTLVKSFQGLADWLGGAGKSMGESISGFFGEIGKTAGGIGEFFGGIGETILKFFGIKTEYKPKHKKPVDIRKLHEEHPAITTSVPSKSFTDYVQKVKSKPEELQTPGVERIVAKLPSIPKLLKTTSKPPEKADIRKLHKEHPAVTTPVPSKSFTDYVQKVKSKPSELRMPGLKRIIAKLP